MSIDVSAAYGEGIILSQVKYDKVKDFIENSSDYWRYIYRIDCYSDESDYFFGKILTYAECGYAEEVGRLEIEDPIVFRHITQGIQEINKRLTAVKNKEKILLCFFG